MSKDGVHGVVPHFAGRLAAPVGVDHHQQPPGPAWQLLHGCLQLPLPVQDHLLALHRAEGSPLCQCCMQCMHCWKKIPGSEALALPVRLLMAGLWWYSCSTHGLRQARMGVLCRPCPTWARWADCGDSFCTRSRQAELKCRVKGWSPRAGQQRTEEAREMRRRRQTQALVRFRRTA